MSHALVRHLSAETFRVYQLRFLIHRSHTFRLPESQFPGPKSQCGFRTCFYENFHVVWPMKFCLNSASQLCLFTSNKRPLSITRLLGFDSAQKCKLTTPVSRGVVSRALADITRTRPRLTGLPHLETFTCQNATPADRLTLPGRSGNPPSGVTPPIM